MSRISLIASTILVLVNGIHGDGYYLFSGPQTIRPQSEYHVGCTTYSLTEPIQARVTINGTDEAGTPFLKSQEVFLDSHSNKLLAFQIGELKPGQYDLCAIGLSGLVFENCSSLDVNTKTFSVFVQTDKAIYKPKDTVQFRVLLLDANTRPYAYKGAVSIYVADGKSNRLKQWDNVDFIKGVFSSKLELSDEPVLGDWKIVVTVEGVNNEKTFEVAEYVLPKFEVICEAPAHVVFKDGKVPVTARAKYTYGKPVEGETTFTGYPTLYIGSLQPFASDSIVRKTAPIDGKATVVFDIKQDFKIEEEYERTLVFDCSVTEKLTGRVQNGTGQTTLHKERYKIELIKNVEEFIPGLPFEFFVKVSYHDNSPVQDTKNPVTISSTYFYDETSRSNQTVYLDENGMAKIDVCVPDNATSLNIVAYYGGVESWIGYVQKASSPSNSFIAAKVLSEVAQVNREVLVNVQTTEAVKEFNYQVLGLGDIITYGTVQFEKPGSRSQDFKFLATFAMVPNAQLVVYYVRPDGELVSHNRVIEFASELQNFVKINLSTNEARPGQDINITVSTAPNSFVGLLGVDQSVLLLKSGNDITYDQVFEDRIGYNSGPSRFRPFRPIRFRRDVLFPWQRDRYEHFENSGLVVLTNTKGTKQDDFFFPGGPFPIFAVDDIAFAQAMPAPEMAFESPVAPAGGGESPAAPTIRKEFPETWIWDDLNFTCFQGETTLTKKVPDTITSWVITGFAVDPLTGLGLTKTPRKLNVFIPFFVSTSLPYKVRRGETVAILIVVFNYQEQDTTADVTLFNDENEFEFADPTNEVTEKTVVEPSRKKKVSVKANSGASVTFLVKPSKLGYIKIKATATSPNAGDGLEQKLLVEPEGVTKYVNEGFIVDLRSNGSYSKTFNVTIPKNFVPDSERVEVSFIGDIMGISVEKLDSLIQMPYGCGEQNMLNFVPNIVAIDYLTKVGKLTPEIKGKATKFMEAGYQRELTYMHADGSFSAFGESDGNGSTWLTAFVIKSFFQAQPYILVDKAILKKGLEFLASVQTPEGTFPEYGKVSHKDMQGGSADGLALTAYVLVTFLECKSDFPEYEALITKTTNYIATNVEKAEDNYIIAIVAYALQISGHSAKDFMLTRLDGRATREGDLVYWKKPIPPTDVNNPWYYRPNSVNVEMTAYALLAYLKAGKQAEAFPILKWLVSQRNENGGFQSTQDTVVGLTACAVFAGLLQSGETSADITVTYDGGKQANIRVDPSNTFILQKYLLPNTVKQITVSATGKGVAVGQLSYHYNVAVNGEYPGFTLDPQVNKNSGPDFLSLTVCTSYVTQDGKDSNMALMEIGLPSGFTADTTILPSLITGKVRRADVKDGDTVFVIYFDNVGRNETCLTVSAYRSTKVANLKPAYVTIIDYYDTGKNARASYSLPHQSTCDIVSNEVEAADVCAPSAQAQQGAQPGGTSNNGAIFSNEKLTGGASGLATISTLLMAALALVLNRFL